MPYFSEFHSVVINVLRPDYYKVIMNPFQSTKVLTHGEHRLQDADGDAAHRLDEQEDADAGEGEEARNGRHAEQAPIRPFLVVLFLALNFLRDDFYLEFSYFYFVTRYQNCILVPLLPAFSLARGE